MMQGIISLLFLMLLTSCSLSKAQNEWQHKSANSFEQYKNNFLQQNSYLAKNNLNRAIKHAKKSADLRTLARVYLGECALNISVGKSDKCEKYTNIRDVVKDKKLEAYFAFITQSITQEAIQLLPLAYQDFAYAFNAKKYVQAQAALMEIDKVSTSLVCGALIRKNSTQKLRDFMIQKASYNGYKKAVLFWLKESTTYAKNAAEGAKYQKKIHILSR